MSLNDVGLAFAGALVITFTYIGILTVLSVVFPERSRKEGGK